MPLGPYAVGDCCVTEFAKLTYIPCMLFFVFFFSLPLFLEVHLDPFECDVQDVSVQPLSQNNSDGGFCDVFIFTG